MQSPASGAADLVPSLQPAKLCFLALGRTNESHADKTNNHNATRSQNEGDEMMAVPRVLDGFFDLSFLDCLSFRAQFLLPHARRSFEFALCCHDAVSTLYQYLQRQRSVLHASFLDYFAI